MNEQIKIHLSLQNVKLTNRRYFKTLETSVINSPLSPLSLNSKDMYFISKLKCHLFSGQLCLSFSTDTSGEWQASVRELGIMVVKPVIS